MKQSRFRIGLFLGIICLFVGAGVIPSTGTIVEKTASIVIGSPGYIQDLIDNASDGDTIYIPSGTYYENIIINKSISLIGQDKETTIIDGGQNGDVINITADLVNISEFTIQGSGPNNEGIHICSSHNIITNNTISFNRGNGIRLENSTNNTICENNIFQNWGWISGGIGIDLRSSSNNAITNNNIFEQSAGVSIDHSNNNIIRCNNISNCTGQMATGIGISLCYSSSNNTITGNTITNNYGRGIWPDKSSNNTITGNNISNNVVGIELWFSSGNNVIGNIISNNEVGIDSSLSSDNNNFTGNNISSNNYSGIFFDGSNGNKITGNTILSNEGDGIYLSHSKFNTITNNIISNNQYGIFLGGHTGTFNLVKIFSDGSNNNIIIKNNFIDNKKDAFFSNSFLNLWWRNYWNEPRLLPKLIFGEIYWFVGGLHPIVSIPWIPKIDLRPALRPYDL